MILSGNEIIKEVKKNNIIITPFFEENVNPNSYNYHLGSEIIIVHELDLKRNQVLKQESVTISDDGYVLYPNTLYLASTYETIGSNQYVTSLIGRSSMGRLGLFLQISANLGHQTIQHKWTLELRCCMPLTVYKGQVIGQVSFWDTSGETFEYVGDYANYSLPKTSKGVEL